MFVVKDFRVYIKIRNREYIEVKNLLYGTAA